jgi:hypothetical protein
VVVIHFGSHAFTPGNRSQLWRGYRYNLQNQIQEIMETHLKGDDVNIASNQLQRSPPARANQVSKDQRNLIKVLSADHDLKTISELTKVPYANVRQIISRSRKSNVSQIVTNPVQAVAERISDELADNERETRLSLSRYARRAAKDSEEAKLRDAPYVHKAAQVAGIVHKWDQKEQNTNVMVNVALLGCDPADVSC